jgi:hypothetical protein
MSPVVVAPVFTTMVLRVDDAWPSQMADEMCGHWPYSGYLLGMKSTRRFLLLKDQDFPPSSVLRIPSAEIAISNFWVSRVHENRVQAQPSGTRIPMGSGLPVVEALVRCPAYGNHL